MSLKKNGILLAAPLLALSLSGCLNQLALKQDARPQVVAAQTEDLTPVAQSVPTVAAEPVVEKVLTPSEYCDAPNDIWMRITRGYALPDTDHPRVDREFKWFTGHQDYLDRVVDRATPYMHWIVEEIEARGMPMEIALLPVVESAFQPFAYSHGRAAGIWQFIPGTGKRYGLKQNWWYDGRRDIKRSTTAALDYLEYLHKYFDGDWLHALAAYNSGEGRVRKAIRKNKRRGKSTDYWSLDLPRETEGYVPKLMAIARLVDSPALYGNSLLPIPNEPYLKAVDVGSQIDLSVAAELAQISLEDLYHFNPGFNRWATDPNGPHELMIPVGKADAFESALAELPNSKRVKWARHTIRSGDTLSTIAVRYNTTTRLLKQVNKLRGSNIRAGKSLIIPVARKSLASYSYSASQRNARTVSTPRNGTKLTHVVRKGDTLWEISRLHKVGVRQLAKWNGMAPGDTLKPGSKLVIWVKEGEKQAGLGNNPANFKHPQMQNMTRRIGYTVRRGDSLSRISQRFNVSVTDLKSWNRLNSKYLQPGQRLKIYVDVSEQYDS